MYKMFPSWQRRGRDEITGRYQYPDPPAKTVPIPYSRKHNWTLYCICAILILIVLLYCVPFPRQINIPLQAYEVGVDGTVIAEEEIVFSATRYRYLLRNDVLDTEKLKIDDIKFTDLSFGIMEFWLKGSFSTYHPKYDHAFYSVYIERYQELKSVYVYIDKEEQWLLFFIESGNNYLICSADPTITPVEIMEICGYDLK